MGQKRILAFEKPELLEEWDFDKNSVICSPDEITLGSNKKVWWKCKNGHSWLATINNRSRGARCPYCSGRKTEIGKSDFATNNPQILLEWDYEKNSIICDPYNVSSGSHTKVWWRCKNDHSWQTSIRERVKGSSCPYCSGKRILKGFNDLKTKYPQLIVEWDYGKNTFLPETVGVGSHKKAWWICKTCGNEWEAEISNRVAGSGCPICGQKKRAISNKTAKNTNSLSYLHPELLEEWDYEKNDSLSPDKVNSGSSQKFWWKCKICGTSYLSSASNRSNGSGCPVCAGKKVVKGINDLSSWCQKNNRLYILEEWDYEKNSLLPTEVTPFANKKIWFVCKEGHSYHSNLANKVINHTGCPICERSKGTSFQEQACFYYLEKSFPDCINSYHEKWLGKLEIDIYIPSLKTGVEYDGVTWHKDSNKDLEKNILCKNNGVKLIRIRENGLLELENCINIFVEDRSSNALNAAILKVLATLKITNTDVDVDRDTSKIIEKYDLTKKDNSIAIKYPHLLKEWDYEKNGKVKPEYVNYGSTRKYWWKCPVCNNEFLMAVNNRTNQNQGCPKCARIKSGTSRISTLVSEKGSLLSNMPEILNEWDYERNTILPNKISIGSKKKVWWKCSVCGGNWLAEIQNRTKKNGTKCPYCSGRKVLSGFNDVLTLHPELSEEWIPEKNNGLLPKDFTAGSSKKITWKCKKCGGEWIAPINDRTSGRGCPYCSGRTILNGVNDFASTNPELLEEWNYSRNEELRIYPNQYSHGSMKKVWWKCRECGHEWMASIGNRVKGQGCPICALKKQAIRNQKKVKCIETSMVFDSVSQAARWAETSPGSIVNNLKGKSKTSKGYHWAYATKDN